MSYSSNRLRGMAIPAALIMMMLIAGTTAILAKLSIHQFSGISTDQSRDETYYAAEGAVNLYIGNMSALGNLWEQAVPLADTPDNYTEYSPAAYVTDNGIPSCSGIACHRHLYPTGGGLLKNLGPLGNDGDIVDVNYPITEQLNPDSPPLADISLGGINAWAQVERLDEVRVTEEMVGANLNNNLVDGGNANNVRFRITGVAYKKLKGRIGYSTVVSVVELPAS